MPTIPFHRLPAAFTSYGSSVRSNIPNALSRLSKQAGLIITSATRTAGAVNYGKFIGNWRSQVVTLNGNQGVLISNPSGLKGATLEWGGKWPNKPPPIAAITRWAMKKFGLPYKAAKKAAWPIRKKIKERGLKPRLIMTGNDTQKSFRMSMQGVFSDVVYKAADRLEKFQ